VISSRLIDIHRDVENIDHGSHHHLTTHTPSSDTHSFLSLSFFPPGLTTPAQPRNPKYPHAATTEPFNTHSSSVCTTRAAPTRLNRTHPCRHRRTNAHSSSSSSSSSSSGSNPHHTPRLIPRSTLHTASQRARGRWLQPHPHPHPRSRPRPTTHDPSRNKAHRRRRRPRGALC
jgi:hypothetical protein